MRNQRIREFKALINKCSTSMYCNEQWPKFIAVSPPEKIYA